VNGTRNVISSAIAAGVKRIVLTSSMAAIAECARPIIMLRRLRLANGSEGFRAARRMTCRRLTRCTRRTTGTTFQRSSTIRPLHTRARARAHTHTLTHTGYRLFRRAHAVGPSGGDCA
jgi:hypothetical protein